MVAALPHAAAFVPATSLAGVRLGDTGAEVRRHLGSDYGLCRGCATTTWYFTYRRFEAKGLAVELTNGRVSGVFTLWKPDGWTVRGKIGLGAVEGEVTSTFGAVVPVACSGYTALVSGTSVYLIVDAKLWGFGLVRRGRSPCR